MADVTLSANIRNNLLALQNTSTLMKQTQNRLATGLKVGSAVDDPVAYFQGTTLNFTMAMTGNQIVLDTAGTISFSYGTYSVTIRVASQDATLTKGATITSGQVISLTIASASGASAANMAYVQSISTAGTAGVTMKAFDGQSTIGVGMTTSINALGKQLEAALTSVRSTASTLGANNALLSTRLDFTTNYMNTLTAGAGKLTLADLNEESANMLALQTRQQLGIQSLSMANQAEQGVLGLFR